MAYFGHVVSGETMDMEKVKAMLEWAVPENVKELRGFLGLTDIIGSLCVDMLTLLNPLPSN